MWEKLVTEKKTIYSQAAESVQESDVSLRLVREAEERKEEQASEATALSQEQQEAKSAPNSSPGELPKRPLLKAEAFSAEDSEVKRQGRV